VVGTLPSTSSPTQLKLLERATSSLGGADADEEMGHSGGNNTNGSSSASPPPSHSSSSDGASVLRSVAPPAADTLLTVPETLLHNNNEATSVNSADDRLPHNRDVALDGLLSDHETIAVECEEEGLAANSTGEIFYVQLDPDSQPVTGVLPGMEQLHVQLMQLRRVLQQNVAALHSLRERARAAGDDVCELHATPLSVSLPSSQTRRRTSRGGQPASARSSGRAPPIEGERVRPSPRFAPYRRTGSVLPYSPVGTVPSCPRHHGDGDNDEESEWCDAVTVNTSSSTTAQSTPAQHPTMLPPLPLQLYEEDEWDDDGRGSHRSSVTGVHRVCVARFRPDSVPSSIQSTPNMQPTSTPYARSDGGGVLCLPPSTSLVVRNELQQQQQHSARPPTSSPAARSPGGSVMSRLENSSLLPPTHHSARPFGQRDSPSTSSRATAATTTDTAAGGGRLSEAEKTELERLSQRVAELYHLRGLLLQKADRILCQHAQQHERWEGNEERRGCYRCRRLFSRLTRRHHCRRCGRLCCAECSRYVGKKQDTSYIAPVSSARGPGILSVAHRVIIKSEYTERMTADDAHVLAEESFDEHTYPRRGGAARAAVAGTATVDAVGITTEPSTAKLEMPTAALNENEQSQLHDVSFADSTTSPENRVGRSHQHKWVRLCAPCYQNCLRARRNNVLRYLRNANLCILDDGYYYYHVMTKDELCQLSTALSKPDSFKKQVELMSHVVMERSVDYVAAAPAYSAHTLATAMQHTPDVLRTLGGISAYALRSARQTANDFVGGYFASSRTILPDNPVGAAAALRAQSAQHREVCGTEWCNAGDGECSEASVESLDSTCSGTQSPSPTDTDHEDGDEEKMKTEASQEYVSGGEETETSGEKKV
jgi:hypothetical protein